LDSLRNARVALIMLVVLVGASTVVYHLAFEWSWVDGLYMTLITITTTGFKEVQPLSDTAKVFTVAVLVLGFSLAVYAGGNGVRAIVEGGYLRARRMEHRIMAMRGHFIVCGFGRMGQVLCRELAARPEPFVVIERESVRTAMADRLGYQYVEGDATDDETVLHAGLDRARGLAAVLGSDADNVFITLTARRQNPAIFILARCAEERSADKLKIAGANRVLNPYERGGVQMAQVLLRPAVVDFIDEVSRETGLNLMMEEVPVAGGSALEGLTLRDSPIRSEHDAIVVAIEGRNGKKTFNPSPGQVLEAGDMLIVLATRASLEGVAALGRSEPGAKGGSE
jgi:voltage-gated potassium channel